MCLQLAGTAACAFRLLQVRGLAETKVHGWLRQAEQAARIHAEAHRDALASELAAEQRAAAAVRSAAEAAAMHARRAAAERIARAEAGAHRALTAAQGVHPLTSRMRVCLHAAGGGWGCQASNIGTRQGGEAYSPWRLLHVLLELFMR